MWSKNLVKRSAAWLVQSQERAPLMANSQCVMLSTRASHQQHKKIGPSAGASPLLPGATAYANAPLAAPTQRRAMLGGMRFRSSNDYSFAHHYMTSDQTKEQIYQRRLELSRHDDRHAKVARNIFEEIKKNEGEGINGTLASMMIEALALHEDVQSGIDVLRFARMQGIRPRISSYSALIGACYKAKAYVKALRLFEVMRKDGYVPMQVTYSHALSSAMKSNKHDLVLEIFDDMLLAGVDTTIVIYNNVLNSCARVGDIHSTLGVLKAIRERNVAMTASTYHSVAICAGKSGRGDLALEMLNGLEKDGKEITPVMANSVISACAKDRRWQDIRDLYNRMTPEQQQWLGNSYLGAVIMAFAKSDDESDKIRAIALLREEKAKGKEIGAFGHNAVLEVLLELQDYNRVIQLANEMREDRIPWDEMTIRNVFCALFELGKHQRAATFLERNLKRMQRSAECFRMLIAHYAEQQDYATACLLSMRMMQKNPKLNRFDWIYALEYSLKLPQRKTYWRFRKWMQNRVPPSIIEEMPPHLMLHSKGKNLLGLDLSMEE